MIRPMYKADGHKLIKISCEILQSVHPPTILTFCVNS